MTDDIARAHALVAEGEAARTSGTWPQSAIALERALALTESALGESIETAVVAQNLAVTYKYVGRLDDAERLHRRALAIAEDAGHDQVVATICHNLGGVAHARGDAAHGITWARRSVAVRATLDDDLALAADRGALAGLLIAADELDEAEELLRAARATFVAHDDALEVAIVDGNLATIALRRGELQDAECRARAALAGKEAALGASSPDLAVTLTTLGTIRRQQGDAEAAVALHERARDVLRPHVEPNHPLLDTIEDNLAAARAAMRSVAR